MSRMTAHNCKVCTKPILKDQLVFHDGKPKHRQCRLDELRAPAPVPAQPKAPPPTPSERVKSQELRTEAVRQPVHRVVADGNGAYNVETAAGTRITPEPVPLKEAQALADKAVKPKSKDKPKPKGRK